MTAAALHAELAGLGLAVVPDGIEADIPDHLMAAAEVLQTGVRAVATGRRWFGATTARPGVFEISPRRPIPPGVGLLCVEGDGCWDRIDPAARLDLPALFEPPPPEPPPRAATAEPAAGLWAG